MADAGTGEILPDSPEGWINWTTREQGRASDPRAFAWVSANAGSGKTHVLTQRVIRLLLAGARPATILCLTYTKAAASEMSNRVFRTLSNWALMDDEGLAREIARVEGMAPSALHMAEARRLFARALDTPGGLKIQTIHAFCEALLHQFPLEANVAGHFTVLDDLGSANLLADVRRNLLIAATAEDDAELANAFATVMDFGSDAGLDQLIGDIVAQRSALRHFERQFGDSQAMEAALRKAIGLTPKDTQAAIIENLRHLPGFSEAGARHYIGFAKSAGGANVLKSAERLEKALSANEPGTFREALTAFVFTGTGTVRAGAAFYSAAMKKQDPEIEARFDMLLSFLADGLDRLKKVDLLEATLAAMTIARRLTADYEDQKNRMGYLDFEDLVERAAGLLTKSHAAQWIHYKLDQGIDHILVDEAQDTSPVQWSIVRSLAEEFFAGHAAKPNRRTLFAVGDEKQSIYSFQGARPEKFPEEGRFANQKAQGADIDFRPIRLPLSFRSTNHVLSAVDQVFASAGNRRGLGLLGEAIAHASSRTGHPGLTAVWEMIEPVDREDEDDWTLPFDATPESAPPAILARRIADTIAGWIGKETIVEDGKVRPIRPGDILVLVRKRDGFVTALTRALKSRNSIPVAGADRLVLTKHIAVQDLLAIGKFILLPEDDLSLAAICKSPLINISEDKLMRAAAHRRENVSLWNRIAQLADDVDPTFSALRTIIESWQTLALDLSPFDFFSRILGPLGGRKKFLARLGSEVTDVLDEFLNVALAHEKSGLPGLQSFISSLELEPPTVKREQDKGRDEVRIMTVHASKGLEAPIVFLVDDGSAPFNANHMPKLRLVEQPDPLPAIPLWLPTSSLSVGLTDEDKMRRAALAEEEYRRLLYVGMTRAADRLIVCGYRKKRDVPDCWHKMVWSALAADTSRCTELTFTTQGETWNGLSWRAAGVERTLPHEGALIEKSVKASLPPGLLKPLPPVRSLPRPLSPSGAGATLIDDQRALSKGSRLFGENGVSNSDAAQKGRLIHRLFQVLPDLANEEREAATRRYLERAAPQWTDEQRDTVLSQVFAVLEDPTLGPLFAREAKAEVNIIGVLQLRGREFAVSGRLDRMANLDDRVILADFKTDRRPPLTANDIPASYITQLGIYRAILKPLYPDKPILCALIFTVDASVFSLDDTAMEAALQALAGAANPNHQAVSKGSHPI